MSRRRSNLKKHTQLKRSGQPLSMIRAKKDITSKQPRFQPGEGTTNPQSFYLSILQWVKSAMEAEPEYVVNTMRRDAWLSRIWQLEPHLAGVLHSVVSIDANRGWSLEGGRNQVMRYTTIFHNWEAAPGIRGWRPGISSASLSYYYTDMGSVVELGRDEEAGPLRGLYHVDSTRCIMNGGTEKPLTYIPYNLGAGKTGEGSKEQDWAVPDYLRMVSMLNTSETMNGIGFCAVSRCLELAKIMVAVYEHDREQLGARAPKGLLLLNGYSEQQWDDAMEARKGKLDGLDYEYFNAVAVLANQGGEPGKAELIALSQLPADFNLQEWTSMLMYGYALCFGYDPSEFYPVQFGSLGRGTEMEVQHEKATGKGGLNFIFALQEQLQRPDVLPASLMYEFDQRDEQSEVEEAHAQGAWVEVFNQLREAGIQYDNEGGISRQEYRMLLADHNIIPKEWTDVEEDVEATDEEGVPSGEGKPVDGMEAAPVPIQVSNPATLAGRQRRILRDKLLSMPHIWRTIERFPDEDIVKYRWKNGIPTVETVWEYARTLREPMMFPSAGRAKDTLLYKSKDVTISQNDADIAIEESKIVNGMHDLLTAAIIEHPEPVEGEE